MEWFVDFVALFTALSKPIVHGLSYASVVTAAGFSPSTHDPVLFIHYFPRGRTLLLLYVDDMIITSDDPEYIAFIKAHLSE
jgi:hypothetical protein